MAKNKIIEPENGVLTSSMDVNSKEFKEFQLFLSKKADSLGEKQKYLRDDTDVDVLYFDNQAVAIDLPVKMEFKVVSAPPGVKGNSAGNVTKQVELETGAVLNVPLFINENDVIRINTDTGEYAERV